MANTTMPNDPQYHSWKPEPLVRGTFSILSSSLLTMILCVWTAVHLNIPEYGGAKAQMWRKTGWMITALLAPEWVSLITLPHDWSTLTEFKVVYTAYCEHRIARALGKTMRKAFDQAEPPGLIETLRNKLNDLLQSLFEALCWLGYKLKIIQYPRQDVQNRDVEPEPEFRRHPWTLVHSLYATMGGFAIDTLGVDRSYLPAGRQRTTLRPRGLKFIAEHTPDVLPNLPEAVIVDKSKANAFTKLVTCGQALWFGVQCATRSAQGLSISLLEINTAVHAICTLTMYFCFWWRKPFDVEEPTILTHADTHLVIAFLVIRDKFPRLFLSPIDMEDDETFNLDPGSEDVITPPDLTHILLRPSKDPKFSKEYYLVYHGFAIPRTGSFPAPTVQNLTDLDFERLKLASEAARKYGLRTLFPGSEMPYRWSDSLAVRSRNVPDILEVDMDSASLLLGFPLAGLFYGSIHLLVWNRPFRGKTDELLWKISSLDILLSGIPIAIVYWKADAIMGHINRLPKSMRIISQGFLYSLLGCCALFYVFCRTFIIVECFLDVFHLPDSAFEVPRWSQYFPHV
jgi:hypothetical protein